MCSRFTWSFVMCSCRLACTLASGDEGRSSAFTLTSILNAASFTLSWSFRNHKGHYRSYTSEPFCFEETVI